MRRCHHLVDAAVDGARAASGSAAPVESAAPSTADLATDQILKIDLGTEPATLDPNKAQSSDSIAVLSALQRRPGLLRQGPQGRAGAGGGLPEVSADAKTLTFHLKDGIKYSNGDPIVAGDFVYSMKRTARPADCRAVRLRHGRGRRCRGSARPRRRRSGADRRRQSTRFSPRSASPRRTTRPSSSS